MTDDDKALVERLRYDCDLAQQLGDEARVVLPATDVRTMADRIEAQAAEIERLREWSLKAFTIVEWVSGEGKLLEYPCYDADDMLGDGVELLGVYSADDARAALGDAHD
jgi:hypothetical protein